MTEAELLAAGAYLPASAKVDANTVVARAYQHVALPGRVVVRLVAEQLTRGDELEMATLGFGEGSDRGAVAKERKRALGFPGWALVHDPANARYALDVVKDFKRVMRRAKAKPGNAKDGIDAIAKTLAASVPQFLPAFYEETGRAFLDAGAVNYAATYFGKARDAEAVHALAVDEQQRSDAFLEFALAGAVPTKAFAQYAKDLGKHHAPAAAYAHFRALCISAVLGGIAPWTGMAKELARLAKAAKLDVAGESRSLVEELLGAPALTKAAPEFWRAYHEPIVQLAQDSPAIRGALVNLFPTAPDADDVWLDLLDASGAVAALLGDAPVEARPANGRAAWFDKLVAHHARRYDTIPSARVFALLRRMAPALLADGVPLRCAHRWSIDLDLCELALELGLSLTFALADGVSSQLQLHTWTEHARKPERGRDPVLAAAHPELGPKLVGAMPYIVGNESFENASLGKRGFHAAKRAWCTQLLERAEQGGVPDVLAVLEQLDQRAKATLFTDLPDLHARFAALDLARALARSLQIGSVDELGWPLLEDVVAELGATKILGGPPAVIVASASKLVAIDATRRLGEFDLIIPAKHALIGARFIQGQFLVILEHGYSVRAYWSSAPTDIFDADKNVSTYGYAAYAQFAAVHADGAWQEGTQVIRAGDRIVPVDKDLRGFVDGTAWVYVYDSALAKHVWREITASGERGRVSYPRVVEELIEDGWTVEPNATYVLPAPAPASPLGVHAGSVGFVSLQRVEDRVVVARRLIALGGATVTVTKDRDIAGLWTVPGSSEPRVLVRNVVYREGVQTLIHDTAADACGTVVVPNPRFATGQAAGLPPTFWHHYTVRDPSGSQRLRAVTVDDAQALLAGIAIEAGKVTATPSIGSALPEISHPRLRTGIAGLAAMGAAAALEHGRLVADRAPVTTPAAQTALPDVDIRAAVHGLLNRVWDRGTTAHLWQQVAATNELFTDADRSDRVVHDNLRGELEWFPLAAQPAAVAFVALALGTQRRDVAVALYAHLRVLPSTDKLRTYTLLGAHGFPDPGQGFDLRWHRGNAYAIRKISYDERYRVLEYAPDGAFAGPPSGTISDELRGAASPIEPRELAAAVASGATSWSTAVVERIAAGTNLPFAAAAYAWVGLPALHERATNFLDKDLREQMGLKTTQATVGRDALLQVPAEKRLQLFARTASAGLAALQDGSAAEAFIAAWLALVGARVAVPEELITAADKELHVRGAAAEWLAAFASPDTSPLLATDAYYGFKPDGALVRRADEQPLVADEGGDPLPPAFDDKVVTAASQYLPFLYASLPVGDPLRAVAPRAHQQILARLTNPHLWLETGWVYLQGAERTAFETSLAGLGSPIDGLRNERRAVRIPGGAIFLDTHIRLVSHPASLDENPNSLAHKLLLFGMGSSSVQLIRYLRSPGLAAMMARIATTPVPAGGWEQNAALSVPDTVAAVAETLGLSPTAAAVYLQYLVLLWPTPKNLALWNAWKPKQVAAAQAELVAKELLVEAKRERAQRTHFLPGAWEAPDKIRPPMEAWKGDLYAQRGLDGKFVSPVTAFVPLAPFHLMFAAAWERIRQGDRPRYEDVKR